MPDDRSAAVADYIAELADADPDVLGVAVTTVTGRIYSAGRDRIESSLRCSRSPNARRVVLDRRDPGAGNRNQELLDHGEHVSGPAAATYRDRTAAGSGFLGPTITSRAQLQDTQNNPALQVHHGELLTCVFRPETALCRSGTDTGDTPRWTGCRSQCSNIARTDRDIAAIRSRVQDLRRDLAGPALPDPLHRRVEDQITFYTDIIRNHVADPAETSAADHRSPVGPP